MNPTQTQTEDPLQTASRILLTPADIDAPILCAELARARGGVDWADIYAQRREVESWRLEEGEVKTGRYSLDCGVGLRALRGEAVAYAHSDEISRRAVSQFAAVARAAKLGQSKRRPSACRRRRPRSPAMRRAIRSPIRRRRKKSPFCKNWILFCAPPIRESKMSSPVLSPRAISFLSPAPTAASRPMCARS